MSANTKLCDGECGNVYYEIDLNEACHMMLCNECMFTFMYEKGKNEITQKHSK